MADQESRVNLTIDGVAVQVAKGTLLVEAAKTVKQEIPVYCYHPKLGPAGLCRVCLVEIEGMPKLQIACNTPVADGMVVHTRNPKVDAGRAMILELLLVNHPLDCPICDKGGECDLQDYAMAYARGSSDLADPKTSKPKGVDLGPTIVLDEERCVVCQRCVRFDEIIAQENQLVLKDRGVKDIIATATGDPYRHNFTGNVTEICPVGALTSKTYRFKSRPWDLERTQTSCTQCSVGCRQFVDVRAGSILRTMSVESDDAISDGWLCDRGRYNIGFYASNDRLTQPLYKQRDQWMQIGWDDAFSLWAKAIDDAISARGARGAAVIGGGRLTNEEAYLLQHIFRARDVENLDWRGGRQRQATPGKNSGSFGALELAQVIIIAGESPAERAPVMDLRIRKAVVRNGAKLIRIGPIEAMPNTPVTDVVSVAAAVAELPKGTERIALVWDGVDLKLGSALAEAFADTSGVSTFISSEQGNARGAESMGMLPRNGGLGASKIFAAAAEGELGVLSIFGANPLLHAPDASVVRSGLERTPFVVVSELFMTATAEAATLVLPAKGAYEKSGTMLNATGDILPLAAALRAPDGVLSDQEMLIGLAQQFASVLPTIEELDARVIELAANAANNFTFGDARFEMGTHASESRSSEGGIRIAVQSASFAGGGTSLYDDRIASLRAVPQAALSPDDSQRIGVVDGDVIDLEARLGSLRNLRVSVRTGVLPGVAVLIGGLPDAPAGMLGENAIARVANIRTSRLPAGA